MLISHHSNEDAWKAARQAGIAQEIEDMPMGMHTLLTARWMRMRIWKPNCWTTSTWLASASTRC